ncbi:Reversal of tor2 lethality [Cadophora gregata]|uniref:Reversal of tor2 lethality n=1 Tax=Cadophora gregata TaxID=51156 RepID=UPI0026DB7876|nr:Reversal of tor2 lethality [Cadophora gregata]KAK0128899.1 Reversal of tor2 lethality [Cadophora gregata]
MSSLSLHSLLIAGVCIISSASALDTKLVGTWSTKSAKVLTGSGFYNPVNDSFIEPKHTGISYSFTADGHYESAYYRAIANPADPKCPGAILQFQHGTVVENADGSLDLTPISVDGRQLQSSPCDGHTSTYTRYNQSENMEKYQVYTDPYMKLTRLDLYQFNGAPIQPMYLAFTPPKMLPTITMNPTTTSAGKKAKRTTGAEPEVNHGYDVPLNKDAIHMKRDFEQPLIHRVDLNMVWWTGVGLTLFGGVAYLL